MPGRDLVVVGGSAGSIEALIAFVAQLPPDLDAPVLVVVHVSPDAPSQLPRILARNGPLPASHASDGDRLEPGRLLVAPPDRHLTVTDGVVRVQPGPRENGHRPAIDPLLRSVARSRDGRTVAVILSGGPGDGILGCVAVRRAGGTVLVQDPEDALFAGMPASIMNRVDVDAALPPGELALEVARRVGRRAAIGVGAAGPPAPAAAAEETTMEHRHTGSSRGPHRIPRSLSPDDEPILFGCPECGGVLEAIDEGEWVRFRCRVGHAYSPEALLDGQEDGIEAALWTALRTLEEKTELLRRLAQNANVSAGVMARYESRAEETEHHAAAIRRLLFGRAPATEDTPESAEASR